MKKKIFSLLLVACMLFGIAATAAAAPAAFADVNPNAWYADEVAWAYEQGLMSGMSDNEFAPEVATTRGMLVTVLWRLEGSPAIFAPNPFEDVAAGKYYTQAVIWAYHNKIVAGMTTTTFCPENDLTREQMATILYNYAQFKGYDVTVSGTAGVLAYYDASSVASYAYEAMIWANANGLVLGSGGYLTPKAPATRAQFASILYRYVDNVVEAEKEEPTVPSVPSVPSAGGHNCTVRNWAANGNDTHSGSCYCGATYTAECLYGNFIPNGDGTHSRTCIVCKGEDMEACSYDHGVCEICSYDNEAVVMISGADGDVYYDDLKNAMDDVVSGDTIVLLDNVTVSEQVRIVEAITFIGGGFTITAADDFVLNLWTENKDRLMEVQAGATIQNVVLDSNSKAYGLQAYGTTDTVTFTDVTVLNSKGTGITINGAVVAASGLVVEGSAWAKSINIDVTDYVAGEGYNTASLTLSGTNTFGDYFAIASDSYNTYDGVTKSVSVTAPGYFAVTGFDAPNANMRVWTQDVSACEAQIGEVYYLSLASAVAAVDSADDVITLIADVEIGDLDDDDYCEAIVYEGAYPIVIDGQDQFTITMAGGTQYCNGTHDQSAGIIAKNTSVTIKNAVIKNEKYCAHLHLPEDLTDLSTKSCGQRYPVYTFVEGTEVAYEDVDFIGGVVVFDKTSFTNCTFTESGTNMYALFADNQYGGNVIDVTMTGCTVTASGYGCIKVADNKNEGGTFIVNNCTFNNTSGKTEDINANGKVFVIIDGMWQISSAAMLQSALDSATGTVTLKLTADITGDVVITQNEGVNITIDGGDHNFTGVMTVFGNGRQTEAETLTIQNINFVAKAGADSCIVSPDRTVNNKYSYAHNVTIDNCTFTDPDGVVNCAAIRHEDGGDMNWTVTNCVVNEGMHSFLQVNNVAGDGLIVSGCKVYSKNGANLNSCVKASFDECEFAVTGYALRFGPSSGGSASDEKIFTVSNSTLKSACNDGDAIIIFRSSSVNAKLTLTSTTLEGALEFKGNTDATTIIIDGVEQ